MASLSCEAYVGASGSWIAMAYRIWLDHCPAEMNFTTKDWRGLFSGLQVGAMTPEIRMLYLRFFAPGH